MNDVPARACGGHGIAYHDLHFRNNVSLWDQNRLGQNDAALVRIFRHFGLTLDIIREKQERLLNSGCGVPHGTSSMAEESAHAMLPDLHGS